MGVIQCGTFSGNTTITLGWEPQWIMIKQTDGAGDWITIDSARGCSVGGIDAVLYPNLSSAESVANDYIDFTATGFISKNLTGTYIYTVIRRQNKPPTSGTQVYNAIARTGTGAAATVTGVGFAPDLSLIKARSTTTNNTWIDRLRGAPIRLQSENTNAEDTTFTTGITSFDMGGVSLGAAGHVNGSAVTFINHFFRRAVGVMSVLCDTGTGSAHTVAHDLGAVPELMIRKGRSGATQWEVYFASLGNTKKLVLNSTAAEATDTTAWNSTTPTSTQITVGTGANVNTNAATYVTYLFSTLAGISKVFSYTGDGGSVDSAGTSQTIDCGFAAGARFVMLKCSSHASDWIIVDTVRGLVAGNDPSLSLNTTAVEVTTTDILDPTNVGFVVNQLAAGTTSANFNVTGRTYVGFAIA